MTRIKKRVAAFALPALLVCSCDFSPDERTAKSSSTQKTLPVAQPVLAEADGEPCRFRIHWPPIDPASSRYESVSPLLTGVLRTVWKSDPDQRELVVSATLQRPGEEASRVRWNEMLEFPEYDWMSKVRVWDADKKWLWPNLPYLLRAHGEERVERYGGVDPGKGVDNDFAAVLIRSYDADGDEHPGTAASPLVGAEWYPPRETDMWRASVIHTARSEVFRLRIPESWDSSQPVTGRLKAWLIYADFLDTPVSSRWPREAEGAGGILAFFTVNWTANGSDLSATIVQSAPDSATGFDWDQYVREFDAESRLTTDLSANDLEAGR